MNEKIKDGLHTEWYESGQKREEGTWKNGVGNGLSTTWYDNGHRSHFTCCYIDYGYII